MAAVSAVLIPVNPEQPVRRINVDGLGDLQAAVGGHIEAVDTSILGDRLTSYINADGKYNGCEPNPRATTLLGPGLFAGDFIAGPLLVCGFDPELGENRDCPTGFEAEFLGVHRPLPSADHELPGDRSVTYAWNLRTIELVRARAAERDGSGPRAGDRQARPERRRGRDPVPRGGEPLLTRGARAVRRARARQAQRPLRPQRPQGDPLLPHDVRRIAGSSPVKTDRKITEPDVVERVDSALVEAALCKIGGGVHVRELARNTCLTETQVIDALCELEEHGRATPWAWTLGPESKR
jgi:Domain of unknown function (DUF3846)